MRKLIVMFLILVLSLVACGDEGNGEKEEAKEETPAATAGAGDASRGAKLFNETVIGSQPGCITCHSLDPGKILVGPSMAGAASRASSRVAGMSAGDYLRESILAPNAFTVKGFASGVMPEALADNLSAQQVEDLVAFILMLE